MNDLELFREHTRAKRRYKDATNEAKSDAALGLGEAGELQNIVKKEIHHDHPIERYKILDEAGDVLFYLDWLMDLYGWNMADVITFNIEKLNARYPEGFSVERSINRET